MDETVARLAVAALGGLAVGLEREWSGHATGPLARFAGLRTFLLIGALGGVAGWLVANGFGPASAVLLASASALVAVLSPLTSKYGGGKFVEVGGTGRAPPPSLLRKKLMRIRASSVVMNPSALTSKCPFGLGSGFCHGYLGVMFRM